jgi:ABC-type transport system involved in cytochrome c biogenesis permease subunit
VVPESILPFGANLALFALVLLQWWGVRRPRSVPGRASRAALISFVVLQSATVIWAAVRSGPLSIAHPWLATMLLTWITIPLCFLLERTAASRTPAATVVSLAFLIHSYALLLGPPLPQTRLTLSPFAESPWYLLYVLCALLGSGAYVCAAGGAMTCLGTATRQSGAAVTRGATPGDSERVMRKALGIAVPSLIGSTIAYAVWTYLVWGSYWSWRPAGVCLLVLCLIMALTLQMGTATRWPGIARASLVLVGLVLALMSVPLLTQGLALPW